ncbi:MAG: NAD-dependent epimerase/dehydratase family protein [Cyclobacteriaceae bacterium]
MKVIILGSQGFIGSNLIQHFLKNGWEVFGCDLMEYSGAQYKYQKVSVLSSDFESLFTNNKFDACINASGSGNVAFSVSLPVSDFEANAFSVIKILDTIRKVQPSCRYLHISSAAVYGNPESLPVVESSPISPLSPYGYHKWISEIICQEYYQCYQSPIAILRPFSVYGNGLRKQLLWDICSRLLINDSIQLSGTGNESRDFIHIHDLVQLVHIILTKASFNCEIYNAASGLETSIRMVAYIFEHFYNGNKKITFSGKFRKGDPLNWRADISKSTTLGFYPVVSIKQGILDYTQWFKSQNE